MHRHSKKNLLMEEQNNYFNTSNQSQNVKRKKEKKIGKTHYNSSNVQRHTRNSQKVMCQNGKVRGQHTVT